LARAFIDVRIATEHEKNRISEIAPLRAWITTTIGEQATLQRGFDITKAQQRPGTIPVISSSGFSSFHDEAAVSGPGVVLGRKGVVGSVYYVESDYWPHDTTLWVKDFHGNEPRFVYYFFRSVAPVIAGMDVGSANPTLNRNHVHPMQILWPDLPVQLRIAEVLGTLDDKIELNRRMNRTLEQMAAAIFKAWFVDFEPVKAKAAGATRFPTMPQPVFDALPTELTDSPLGPIPKGWEVKTIADLARFVNGKAFTKHATGTGRMIIRIAELNSGSGGSTKYSDIETDQDFTAYPDDILFSWSGSLGVYRWHRPDAIINQHIFKVVPNDLPKWFVYYALLEALPYFRMIAAGKATTMGHIQRHHLSDVELASPPQPILDGASAMDPLYRKVHGNELESQTLTALRDTLLPKLLSGEIRVGVAEKLVEEVE
jgi:type I restriction enzyme S subunit